MGWFSFVMTNCAFRLPPAYAGDTLTVHLELGETRNLTHNPGCSSGPEGYNITDDASHIVLCKDACTSTRAEPSKVTAAQTCP